MSEAEHVSPSIFILLSAHPVVHFKASLCNVYWSSYWCWEGDHETLISNYDLLWLVYISSKCQQMRFFTPVQLGTCPMGSVNTFSTQASSALRAVTRWATGSWQSPCGTREIPRVKKEMSKPDEGDCSERTVQRTGMVSLGHSRGKGGTKKVSEIVWVKTQTFPWSMEM